MKKIALYFILISFVCCGNAKHFDAGFKEKQKIFNNDVQIGYESYDVEFNPKFMKFYELLKSLVNRD